MNQKFLYLPICENRLKPLISYCLKPKYLNFPLILLLLRVPSPNYQTLSSTYLLQIAANIPVLTFNPI